ncbi:MAG: dTDP-3-amino-2,3,6-trideoxy-4-keto-D-glucose/dTDP-3-amino-3,4,6-trideoxy-alpha-D-glucopyranose [Gaiellaceae bacterium]|nr:dTDP-3-amino-2,3,6-trideoxy-4-keto-D-glucose/dTDP-3-amino-3,4,6-trideoxy-alpha-D-glucopyranose [Gaiellaceae bacterium]
MFSQSARVYDAIYASIRDYPREAEELHRLIQSRRPGARTLLDVACGTAAHLADLRPHYEVEGVDLDPEMLAVARERLPDVEFHEADMTSFDLGRRFDAVVCMFSSIGYVRTVEGLDSAVAAMARHVEPGGLLVVEPWLAPEAWRARHVHAVFVDEPELKIARISMSGQDGNVSIVDFHYLVGTPDGVEQFTERHELGLFTVEEHLAAFRAAGLEVEHDPEGPMGRGLYVAVAP